MRLNDYDEDDGKRVWLSNTELDSMLNEADGTEQQIALGLAARCGLRAQEVVDVEPADVVETPTGTHVRVWHGKGDKYREPPVPDRLVNIISTYAEMRDESADTPLVDKSPPGHWSGGSSAPQSAVSRRLTMWDGSFSGRTTCAAPGGRSCWRRASSPAW